MVSAILYLEVIGSPILCFHFDGFFSCFIFTLTGPANLHLHFCRFYSYQSPRWCSCSSLSSIWCLNSSSSSLWFFFFFFFFCCSCSSSLWWILQFLAFTFVGSTVLCFHFDVYAVLHLNFNGSSSSLSSLWCLCSSSSSLWWIMQQSIITLMFMQFLIFTLTVSSFFIFHLVVPVVCYLHFHDSCSSGKKSECFDL